MCLQLSGVLKLRIHDTVFQKVYTFPYSFLLEFKRVNGVCMQCVPNTCNVYRTHAMCTEHMQYVLNTCNVHRTLACMALTKAIHKLGRNLVWRYHGLLTVFVLRTALRVWCNLWTTLRVWCNLWTALRVWCNLRTALRI